MTLRELIADRIRTQGPLTTAEFMGLALYHPSLGYYSRAPTRTGRAGDFFTSVDVGPQFGEPAAVDDERKSEVEQHDRDMLSKFLEGDSREFIEAMSWSKNPTRWCSIGNMAMLLDLAGPDGEIELLDYRQATHENGVAMVSASACALL